MRKNTKAYEDFYTNFLPCMVGRRKFNKLVVKGKSAAPSATISDEAMTLLGLENSIETWSGLFKNSNR